MSTGALATPLGDTLARLRRLGPVADRLALAGRASDCPIPAPQLCQVGPELAGAVSTFTRTLGTSDERVAASLFGQAYALVVTHTTIVCLVVERRVPDVAAANTAVCLDAAGRPVSLALTTPRCAVLSDDPAAAHPDSEVVADFSRLVSWARQQAFDDHLGPFIDALTVIAPVGRRTLWGNVAAACAKAFAALDVAGIDHDRLLGDATALLDAPDAPTRGLARLFAIDHGNGRRLFVRRETCCLYYRLPGAVSCLSCRLLSDAERRARITSLLSGTS